MLGGGSLTRGGMLEVRLIDDLTPNYTPVEGDAFLLLTAGNILGDFGATDLPVLGGGLTWSMVNDGQNFSLTVVPVPSTFCMLGPGLLFLLRLPDRSSGRRA